MVQQCQLNSTNWNSDARQNGYMAEVCGFVGLEKNLTY